MKRWCFNCLLFIMLSPPAMAQQTIPGSTEAGRVEPFDDIISPPAAISPAPPSPSASPFPSAPIPEDAKYMSVLLRDVRFEGMTAFRHAEMADLYAAYSGKRITLDVVWQMANEVTRRYRDKGYFLSRAYVPPQNVDKGIVTIRVVEGYIGEVALEDPAIDTHVIRALAKKIKAQRPLNAKAIESLLLQLNDLPGYRFRSILEPKEEGEEGEVRLVIVPQAQKGKGRISLDNYGSRYLGPHQLSANYQASVLPFQETTLALMGSVPPDELGYALLRHEIPVYPAVTLGVQGSYVRAEPGYVLEANNVESNSLELSVDMRYTAIRQRDETLAFSAGIRGKNTDTDISGLPLTDDHIRALWVGADYNTYDASRGYHYTSLKLTQGLRAFGASDAGELTLSRAEADPDFTKAEAYYQHQRFLSDAFLAVGQVSGQYASGPLFSSEEFGFGGQRFGRGYDPSELTGDHGLAFAVELRYMGLPEWNLMQITPFAFYDVGAVWNEDNQQEWRESAASAGGGLYGTLPAGVLATLTLAKPLTYDAGTPLYGARDKDTRFLFQLSADF